ncbi:hypothetical protein [Abyssisolibacter fermentans]|uniref:hypothetical protein n=1 Tax=Abyssisolibacter fermentans TaxID=1766203 RepID=UPI00082D9879|nr:hypothetical protein [Abyssisolibacter fermentans]
MKKRVFKMVTVVCVFSLITLAITSQNETYASTKDGKVSNSTRKVVNYSGTPIKVGETLQKFVTKYTKTDAEIPQTIKDHIALKGNSISSNLYPINLGVNASVIDKDGVMWFGANNGMMRIDPFEKDERDKVQYFTGPRYFYDTNNKIEFIVSDNNKGVWVLTETGVSHIEMKPMGYTEKAILMSNYTQENVSRRGMVSQSKLVNGEWVPEVSDNDGLWTAMYAAGECFRYAVETDPVKKEEARKRATKSVEAVLLLANISSRDGEIDAKIRHLVNESNLMSKEYLRKDGDSTFLYPIEGPVGMKGMHLLNPADIYKAKVQGDWVTKGEGETQKRTMKGFIARSYHLDGLESEPVPIGDGFFFKKMLKDGKMISKAMPFEPGTGPDDPARSEYKKVNRRAKKVEDFAGIEVDASLELPARLANLYRSIPKGDGTNYTDTDVIYKADTSTDEIIGHLFIYKVAYDTLCAGPNGDKELGQIIVDTSRNIAQHVLENDYCLTDATGQPTSWGKMTRNYFNNDYAWEDCTTNSLVLLSVFKTAAYLTGESKWETEYCKLALADPYRYADLQSEYRDRFNEMIVRGYKEDHPYAPDNDPRLDPYSRETAMEVQAELNYSDEEMAMLAYYLLFQMETDSTLIEKYRAGIDDWWISIQYGNNPLWFYIYQLAYPNTLGKANLETAAWALKRHPIDTRRWLVDNSGRNDIIDYNGTNRALSKGPNGNSWFVALPMDEMDVKKYNRCPFEIKGGSEHGEILDGSTTYTLPYWLGRFHGMITE